MYLDKYTTQIFKFQKYSKYFKSILLKVVLSSITSFFHSEECTVFRNITLIFLMGCIFFTVVHYNVMETNVYWISIFLTYRTQLQKC